MAGEAVDVCLLPESDLPQCPLFRRCWMTIGHRMRANPAFPIYGYEAWSLAGARAQPAAERPASIPSAILVTSAAVRIRGGDRMMVLPETRSITPAS